MSAREPFARVVLGVGVQIDGAYTLSAASGPLASEYVYLLNAAHADRVAAELEAAADAELAYAYANLTSGKVSLIQSEDCMNRLRARAKAIREGGGK